MDWDFEDFGGYRITQHWKPEELTSMIVFKMKMMAETHMGGLVKDDDCERDAKGAATSATICSISFGSAPGNFFARTGPRAS